jgi:hypothetical protein
MNPSVFDTLTRNHWRGGGAVACTEQTVDFRDLDLDLHYGSDPYALTDYDVRNLSAAYKAIVGEGGDLAILGPTTFGTVSLVALVCAIGLVQKTVHAQGEIRHQSLKKGDIVLYKGKRARFIGVEAAGSLYDNQPKLKMEFSDMTLGIDLEDAWRLVKCGPMVTRVDKFGRAGAYRNESPLEMLTEMLGYHREDMSPALNTKLIVVAAKRDALDHYPNLYMGDTPYASILPAAYYSRVDGYEPVGRDPLQRDPLICFTSNVTVATHLVRGTDETSAMIVHNYDRLRGNLSHIERLRARNIRTVLLSDIHRLERDDIDGLNQIGFDVITWMPEDFEPLDVEVVDPQRGDRNPLVRAKALVSNMAYWENEEVLVPCEHEQMIASLRARLCTLSTMLVGSNEMVPMLRFMYGILAQLTWVPLPQAQLGDSGDCEASIYRLYDMLPVVHRAHSWEGTSLLKDILKEFESCISCHRHQHPKYEAFVESLNELDQNGCVLVRSNRHRRILRDWLFAAGYHLRAVTCNEALSSSPPIERSLALGWYGSRHALLRYSGFSLFEKRILYPFERRLAHASGRRFPDDILGMSTQPESESESGASAPRALEDMMDVISREWAHSYVAAAVSSEVLSDIPAVLVEFEEDAVAFLAPGYSCQCLDWESEEVVYKTTAHLEPGDVMIFVKDSTVDMLSKLARMAKEQDPTTRELARLAEIWRSAFVDHLDSHALTLAEFQEQLRLVGVERDVTTIGTWRKKDCIGPEEDAIRGIAQLTGDRELNDNLDQVLEACQRIRGLHITLGRYLARSVVASIAGEVVVEEDPVLHRITDDLTKHAELATVRRISHREVSVPAGKANRLLDMLLDT